ncbi:unnamed protein product [Amoebophrya sp. A120]|nr:unnamed protein product [Amoebophrya sp. A120]|eukprot:GSA120T00006973001.1
MTMTKEVTDEMHETETRLHHRDEVALLEVFVVKDDETADDERLWELQRAQNEDSEAEITAPLLTGLYYNSRLSTAEFLSEKDEVDVDRPELMNLNTRTTSTTPDEADQSLGASTAETRSPSRSLEDPARPRAAVDDDKPPTSLYASCCPRRFFPCFRANRASPSRQSKPQRGAPLRSRNFLEKRVEMTNREQGKSSSSATTKSRIVAKHHSFTFSQIIGVSRLLLVVATVVILCSLAFLLLGGGRGVLFRLGFCNGGVEQEIRFGGGFSETVCHLSQHLHLLHLRTGFESATTNTAAAVAASANPVGVDAVSSLDCADGHDCIGHDMLFQREENRFPGETEQASSAPGARSSGPMKTFAPAEEQSGGTRDESRSALREAEGLDRKQRQDHEYYNAHDGNPLQEQAFLQHSKHASQHSSSKKRNHSPMDKYVLARLLEQYGSEDSTTPEGQQKFKDYQGSIEILANMKLRELNRQMQRVVCCMSTAENTLQGYFPELFTFLRQKDTERIFLWASVVHDDAINRGLSPETLMSQLQSELLKQEHENFSLLFIGVGRQIVEAIKVEVEGGHQGQNKRNLDNNHSSITSTLQNDDIGRPFVNEVLGNWLSPDHNCKISGQVETGKPPATCPVPLSAPGPQVLALFAVVEGVIERLIRDHDDEETLKRLHADLGLPAEMYEKVDISVDVMFQGITQVFKTEDITDGSSTPNKENQEEPRPRRKKMSQLARAALEQFKAEANNGNTEKDLDKLQLCNQQLREFLSKVSMNDAAKEEPQPNPLQHEAGGSTTKTAPEGGEAAHTGAQLASGAVRQPEQASSRRVPPAPERNRRTVPDLRGLGGPSPPPKASPVHPTVSVAAAAPAASSEIAPRAAHPVGAPLAGGDETGRTPTRTVASPQVPGEAGKVSSGGLPTRTTPVAAAATTRAVATPGGAGGAGGTAAPAARTLGPGGAAPAALRPGGAVGAGAGTSSQSQLQSASVVDPATAARQKNLPSASAQQRQPQKHTDSKCC